jgi:hypothetical protein
VSADFRCLGCGSRESFATVGIAFIYAGECFLYAICAECATATGKRLDAILQRIDLAMLPEQGSA